MEPALPCIPLFITRKFKLEVPEDRGEQLVHFRICDVPSNADSFAITELEHVSFHVSRRTITIPDPPLWNKLLAVFPKDALIELHCILVHDNLGPSGEEFAAYLYTRCRDNAREPCAKRWVDSHSLPHDSVQIWQLDGIVVANRVLECPICEGLFDFIAKLGQGFGMLVQMVEDRRQRNCRGIAPCPDHGPYLSSHIEDAKVVVLALFVDDIEELAEHIASIDRFAGCNIIHALLYCGMGLVNHSEESFGASSGVWIYHLREEVKRPEPVWDVCESSDRVGHHVHQMAPIVVVNVVADETKATFTTVEYFTCGHG